MLRRLNAAGISPQKKTELSKMRLTGAGVLVYSIYNGELLVLLGREREMPGWRQGSHKWSAFTGRVESHEDALQGAAREFIEESCACLPIAGVVPKNSAEAARLLQKHAHPVELTSVCKGEQLRYNVYMARVEHSAYELAFARTRARLMELDAVFRQFYRAKKTADAAPRFFLPGFVLSADITVVDFHVLNEREVEVVMRERAREADLVITFDVDPSVAVALCGLEAAWERVREYIQQHQHDPIFQHPGVHIACSQGRVVAAYVNKAYLEKCEIRWWRLEDLLTAHAQPWVLTGQFRKFFLDNLWQLSKHLKQLEAEM
jgi:predicted NUDIX family NTP pyrophosphohydrolase